MSFYYSFEAFWGIFELVNVAVVAVISAIIIFVLSKHKVDRAPIFLWALDLKKSKKQIEMLLASTFIFILVFSIYVAGEFLNYLAFIISAQIIGIASYLLVSYVIFLWFKEFLRFV